MHQDHKIPFNDWLKSESGKFYGIVSLVFTFIYSVITIVKPLGIDKVISNSFKSLFAILDGHWIALNFLIQIIFILFVIFIAVYRYMIFDSPADLLECEKTIWNRLTMNRPGTPKPKNANESIELWRVFKVATNRVAKQFTVLWFWCWVAWLVLYLIIMINSWGGIHISDKWQNLANNLSSLMFIFMFMTFTVSTSRYGVVEWTRLFIPIFLILILEHFSTKETEIWYSLLSGLIASFAMAAFFGRLTSKFINVPLWAILFLHLYAAIQPLYVFFSDFFETSDYSEAIMVIVGVVAFFLKILLFLIMTWILQTGRMVFFIIEESSVNFERDDRFFGFLESTNLKENKLTGNRFP